MFLLNHNIESIQTLLDRLKHIAVTGYDLNVICQRLKSMTQIVDLVDSSLELLLDECNLVPNPFFMFLQLLQHSASISLILIQTDILQQLQLLYLCIESFNRLNYSLLVLQEGRYPLLYLMHPSLISISYVSYRMDLNTTSNTGVLCGPMIVHCLHTGS